MVKKLLVIGVFLSVASIGKTASAANVQGVYEGYSTNSMLWEMVVGRPLYVMSLSDITGEVAAGCTAYVKVHSEDEAPEEIDAYYTSFVGKKISLTDVTIIEKERQPHRNQVLCEFDKIETVE